MAKMAKILVNIDLKKFTGCVNWAVIIKEISVRTSAKTVHIVLFEFKIIKSIKMQLVELWQKTVVEFEQSEHANLVTAKWSILIGKNAIHVARSDKDKKS
ncbi:hypothetical protein G9A89_001349 [Geosiphon pyriformis]|nr:hypothetical protein G9A89_001349 [Geosiphon pyriformis]